MIWLYVRVSISSETIFAASLTYSPTLVRGILSVKPEDPEAHTFPLLKQLAALRIVHAACRDDRNSEDASVKNVGDRSKKDVPVES